MNEDLDRNGFCCGPPNFIMKTNEEVRWLNSDILRNAKYAVSVIHKGMLVSARGKIGQFVLMHFEETGFILSFAEKTNPKFV